MRTEDVGNELGGKAGASEEGTLCTCEGLPAESPPWVQYMVSHFGRARDSSTLASLCHHAEKSCQGCERPEQFMVDMESIYSDAC